MGVRNVVNLTPIWSLPSDKGSGNWEWEQIWVIWNGNCQFLTISCHFENNWWMGKSNTGIWIVSIWKVTLTAYWESEILLMGIINVW